MSMIAIYLYIVVCTVLFHSFRLGFKLTKEKAYEANNRRMDLLTDNDSIMDLICHLITTEEFCKINNIILHTNAKESYIQINENGMYEMFTTRPLISSISFAQFILMKDLNLSYVDKKIFNTNFFFGCKSMQYFLNECITEVNDKFKNNETVPREELVIYTLRSIFIANKYYKF